MGKKFYYIREFSTSSQFDELDNIQRLLVSASVTKKITGDSRDSVEILFNNDGTHDPGVYNKWRCYQEFVRADDVIKQSGLAHYYDYANEHCYELHFIKLDASDLNADGKSSLMNIACRAFIIAASQHSINQEVDWFKVSLYEWSQSARRQKKRAREELQQFLEQKNIYARIDNTNQVHIFPKKQQDEYRMADYPNHLLDTDEWKRARQFSDKANAIHNEMKKKLDEAPSGTKLFDLISEVQDA